MILAEKDNDRLHLGSGQEHNAFAFFARNAHEFQPNLMEDGAGPAAAYPTQLPSSDKKHSLHLGHLLGEDLGPLSVRELQNLEKPLEKQLEGALTQTRQGKHEMILVETENLNIREMELDHAIEILHAKVAVNDRLHLGSEQEQNAFAFLARNAHEFQPNLMEDRAGPAAAYPTQLPSSDKKHSLHLGHLLGEDLGPLSVRELQNPEKQLEGALTQTRQGKLLSNLELESFVYRTEMDSVLSDELLEEVLRRLPPRSTFSLSTSDVSLVSKRWLRLYRSTRSTLSLHLSSNNNFTSPSSLSSFLSHYPHLSFLYLTIADAKFAITSPSPDHLFLSVASSFPRLRLLCLQSNPLSLSTLLSLSTSCPHLTALYIALPRPFSLHWLLSFHSLKNLGVHFTSVPVQSESERVDVASRVKSLDDAELKLESLTLSGIRQGDRGLDWLWRSCKRLRKLLLHCCEGIGVDTSVLSFVDCFKGLQEVELRFCNSIADEILSVLAETCASLSSLLVHGCDGGRAGLLQFAKHSYCNLQKLNLRLPIAIKNDHLLALAQNFRGLLSLRLEECCNVTGEGLKSMMLALSNELEELALVDCYLKPGMLTTLGQKFRNLRKLDLSDNQKLVDKEFILMLASFSFLTELKMTRCRGLTNASLFSMFESCKQLESVDIVGCTGIEAAAVDIFVLSCLRLRQIHVESSKLSDVSRSWASKKFIEIFPLS